MNKLELNGVSYNWPHQPVVVVCIDGGDPAYIEQGLKDGILPNIEKFMREGYSGIANGTVPSFTCPNNMSLITGAPPSVHGISGNYYLNENGEAVVMTGPELLRSPTILATFANAGAKVVSITAKDKLRKQLGKGLDLTQGNVSFSSEFASQCTLQENGITNVLELVGMPQPDMYSMDLSLFVLEAGIKLLERDKPQLLFLSLTDYIQHKFAPGTAGANEFYAMMDGYMAQLDAMGCLVVLTADHGMNAKVGMDGQPQVIYLQDWFDAWLGVGSVRVILPITDPYVVHHGALGSFATIYLPAGTDPAAACQKLQAEHGIEVVLTREQAAAQFELPADRLGDLVVVSERDTVLGTSKSKHDLSGLDVPLRSHGGISEQRVPLVMNRAVPNLDRQRRWRNFDAFDLALNFGQSA